MGDPRDLFSVFVDGVIDTDEEADAVKKSAASVSGRALLASAASSQDLVAAVVESSIRVSVRRLHHQAQLVRDQVKAEGTQLARTDVRKLKPVRSVQVATQRTERQRAATEQKP